MGPPVSGTAAIRPPRLALLRRLLEKPGAVAGLLVMLVLVAAGRGAPYVAPHGPAEQFRDSFLAPPFEQATFPSAPTAWGATCSPG